MSICVSHTKNAAVLRKRGIGYMKAVFYILIFTLWPSDSKSSRLYEAGFLYPVFYDADAQRILLIGLKYKFLSLGILST